MFEYKRFLRTNEIDLVNRKIGKIPSKSDSAKRENTLFGSREDTLADLEDFFMRTSKKTKELQLNYFLVKSWRATEHRKKGAVPVHIFLSVDFCYSVYLEATDKAGYACKIFKRVFHAETSKITVKEVQKVVEITFKEKGLLWNSSKKMKLEFAEEDLDEFVLHHQQALAILGRKASKKDSEGKSNKKMTKSSIQLSGKYQDSTDKVESVKSIKKQKAKTSEFDLTGTLEDANGDMGSGGELEEDKRNNMDEQIQRVYQSEKDLLSNGVKNEMEPRELDDELVEELKSEVLLFKKKIGPIEEMEESKSENMSQSSQASEK